jgi:hypothetical protein
MSENLDVPEGFIPLADPEADAVDLTIIEAERWEKGAVVVYRGQREWKSAKGELHRAHAMQREADDSGALYGVWSTSVLDRLFKQVSIGERVFLRYDGMTPHPTLPTRSVHNWTVARATMKPASDSKRALPFS